MPEPAVTCRYCGRPIKRSQASGLWWAADELLLPACVHEPKEVKGGDSDARRVNR